MSTATATVQTLDTNDLTAATRALVRAPGREGVAVYYTAVNELVQQWKETYLFAAILEFKEFTAPVLEALYAKAYTDGHSAGYHEIESYFYDNVEFARNLRALSL